MREEQTLFPSNEYHNDGTGSPETNIYLPGAHVTVDSDRPIYPSPAKL